MLYRLDCLRDNNLREAFGDSGKEDLLFNRKRPPYSFFYLVVMKKGNKSHHLLTHLCVCIEGEFEIKCLAVEVYLFE